MLDPLAPKINYPLKRETVLLPFTLENKVLGPPDSIIDSFLPRHAVLVSLC
jgi:hypothetical protein